MNDLPKLANSLSCSAVSKHRLSLVLLATDFYRYFTCSQLPGLRKASLLALKSENVLVSKIRRRGRQRENVRNAKGLISKITSLQCTIPFLNISLPFFHDYDVKISCFMKDEN